MPEPLETCQGSQPDNESRVTLSPRDVGVERESWWRAAESSFLGRREAPRTSSPKRPSERARRARSRTARGFKSRSFSEPGFWDAAFSLTNSSSPKVKGYLLGQWLPARVGVIILGMDHSRRWIFAPA
jgi:hypothetical protein